MLADSGSSLPLDFVQYGVLGLVILALLAGWLWTKPAVDQLRADMQRITAQRDALIEVYEKQVIPVLTDVQREFVPTTSRMTEEVRALQAACDRDGKELLGELKALRSDVASLQRKVNRPGARS